MLTALIPQCVALIIFGTYVGLGNKLSVEKAFTIIAMITLMRTSVRLFPRLGFDQINNYLKMSEKENMSQTTLENQILLKEIYIIKARNVYMCLLIIKIKIFIF